jgi:hypothetical protein
LAGAIEPKVSFANIAEHADHFIGINELFSGATNVSPLTFGVKWPAEAPLPEKLHVVLAGFIPLPDVTLVYYGIAEMRPEVKNDMVFWKSHTVEPREILALNSFPAGYEEFVDRAKAKENIDNVMMAEVPDVQLPVVQPPTLGEPS